MTTYEERPDIITRTVERRDERPGAGADASAGGHGRLPAQHTTPTHAGRPPRRPRRIVHAPTVVDGAGSAIPRQPGPGGRSDEVPAREGRSAIGSTESPAGQSPGTARGPGAVGPTGQLASPVGRPVPATRASLGADIAGDADAVDGGDCVGGDGALETVRAALASAGSCRASLLMVADHRTDRPRVFTAPVDLAFAGQLLDLALDVTGQAAAAEWRPALPGFAPSAGQWLWTPTAGTALDVLDDEVCRPTHPPYQRTVDFGRSNLLALRVRSADGSEVLRLYQGFSPDKALGTGRRLVAFWSGERFSALTEPLVVDRSFRVIVAQGVALMPTAASYEGLFGPPTALRVEAAATFTETFEDALAVRGVDELRTACLSDLNMMRKLVSIRRRLADPRFRAALTMDRILAFLAANPQITVPVDHSGPVPALVFEPGPQQRWALLKLLDDDYLRSDLTDYRYEANSKSEVR